MKIFDFYGIDAKDGREALLLVSEALGTNFEIHQGDYWGEYYRSEVEEGGYFRIVSNLNDGEWQEEDYKNFAWLLEVNNIKDQNGIFERISRSSHRLSFLYRSEVQARKAISRYEYRDGEFRLMESTMYKGK